MRLIDADALERHMDVTFRLIREVVFAEDIDNAPTVDAVEVVRCKDCKWFIPADKLPDGYANEIGADGLCDNADKYTDFCEFCSYGERREENAVD